MGTLKVNGNISATSGTMTGTLTIPQIIGNSNSNGLIIKSANNGTGAGWSEGLWIEPAYNTDYATLALGKTDRSSVIAIVHNKDCHSHYLEMKNSRGQWIYTLPEVSGTLLNTGNYSSYALSLSGGTLNDNSVIKFSPPGGTISTSDPMTITYGRISTYGNLCINANTDNAGTEYVILTAGKGLSSSISDGLAIGTSTLTWQGSTVITADNITQYKSGSTNLLAIHNTLTTNSTRLIGTSSWNGAVSGLNYVWGQSFADTSISNDPGDLVLGLRPAQYSSGAELCMMIDGDYYSMGNKVLHAGNWSSYCAAKSHSHSYLPLSGGTMTGHLYAISELTWNHAHWLPNGNIYCQPTGNNQEWSFDVGAPEYIGCYWHVWSAKNGCSMLSCHADDNSIHIPNGPFVVGSKCYGGSLPGGSYYGQVFFLT